MNEYKAVYKTMPTWMDELPMVSTQYVYYMLHKYRKTIQQVNVNINPVQMLRSVQVINERAEDN